MRPEMTKRSILKILEWEKLKSLTVVIDGLRNTANAKEEEWRKETIRVSEALCGSKVSLLVYDTNIGITDHVNRVQRRILPQAPNAIWVEEDFDLNFNLYTEFLVGLKVHSTPFLICGNAQANHTEIHHPLRTFFPPYWGQVLNLQLTEEIEKIRIDKKIDLDVSRDFFNTFSKEVGFPRKFLIERQVKYWDEYFNWAVNSPNRWDALATYVLWRCHNPTFVSPLNLVTDQAEDDFRGMNTRHEKQEPRNHSPKIMKMYNSKYCMYCEKRKSRVANSFREAVYNNFKYKKRIFLERFSKTLNYIE
jgi:hypothetical protein